VRFPFQGTTPTVDDLHRVTLTNALGAPVPLGQVASLELARGTGRIDHYDDERVATVTAFAVEGYSVLDVTQEVSAALEAMDWPVGYRWFAGGTFEEQQEGFAGMIRALLVAVLGIFAVLVLQFKSFLQPLIVFASIPLAFIGAVLALLVTGYTFSFTAFIGVTSLVGIVINNSIILVHYANEHVRDGDDVTEALRKSGETRFQPIVLTTLTTVGGLVPLALSGSEMWSPLAVAIIGGLLTSTVLTLLLVPALYRVVHRPVRASA
jgi:multidrug efflux pump subunit AcrB